MPSYPDEYRREGSGDGRRPTGGSPIIDRSLESRRELALERLTTAFAEDRMSMEDYELRATAVQRADDAEELARLVADLPESAPAGRYPAAPRSPGAPRPPRAPERPSAPLRVDPGLSGGSTVACVMGERNLQGDWLNGDKVDAFTLMGSTKLDLRDTALPEGRLRIEVFCLMGETKVVVPRGLPVRIRAFPFMGEARAARDVDQRIDRDGPYVDIEGFVMMGSLVVVAAD